MIQTAIVERNTELTNYSISLFGFYHYSANEINLIAHILV